MLFSTIGQFPLFLWMTGAGILAGVLYTFFSLLRRLLDAGFWLTLAADILFGLCTAFILCTALLAGNYGQVRFFTLLGTLMGFSVYFIGPHQFIMKSVSVFARRLRRIFVTISEFRLIKVIFK